MSSSPEPRHAQRQQRRRRLPAPATPAACGDEDAGAVPLDVLCEILLRLPGKQLCRLRTVCRAWRSLLTAPWFAAAHAARRSDLYIVASYVDHADRDRDSLVDVLDMSTGQIVRHVAAENAGDVVVMSVAAASGGLVCVKTIESGSFRLLNPVTGAVHHLSDRLAPEHAARGFSLHDYGESEYMFGQVAGTGELKVLRMLRRGGDRDHLFEVCTLRSSGARWRGMQGPPTARSFVSCGMNALWSWVVVGGVVYGLSAAAYLALTNRLGDDEQGSIVRFDLEAEQWRPSIKGPSGLVDGQNNYNLYLTLTNLNGSLVIVLQSSRVMDLWFMKDSEQGLWVKQYSVQIEPSVGLMHPLLVLEDGRIVTVIRSMGLLQIYDPRTSTFTCLMRLRHSSRVSIHAGSFLSLHGEN